MENNKTAEEILQLYALTKSRFMQIEYRADDVLAAMEEYAAQQYSKLYTADEVREVMSRFRDDLFYASVPDQKQTQTNWKKIDINQYLTEQTHNGIKIKKIMKNLTEKEKAEMLLRLEEKMGEFIEALPEAHNVGYWPESIELLMAKAALSVVETVNATNVYYFENPST